MALNSSSRAQLTQKTAEKSSSPLSKLIKVFTDTPPSTEQSAKNKKPAMKSKQKTSWSSSSSQCRDSTHAGNASSTSATPSTPSILPVMASDSRFPPLASSYPTPPAPIDWRSPLEAQAASGATTLSTRTTTATITTITIAFPPVKNNLGNAPAAVAPCAPPPAPSATAPAAASGTTPPPAPRPTVIEDHTAPTIVPRAPAQRAEQTLSAPPEKPAGREAARRLFSTLEQSIERLLWHPSASTYQQLAETIRQMGTSGLDYSEIDASSLVLRILVDPGKENLDQVISWMAKLGCSLVSGASTCGLNRSSVLERAVERGWPATVSAIANRLRQHKVLHEYAEAMLVRAMQADKPLSLLQKALQFSADYCRLQAGMTMKMISTLTHLWQFDPYNTAHPAKFKLLFDEAERQEIDTLPIATLLQVATKFHHAPMALTMLELNANTDYLDEQGKTVTDLAHEAQQLLTEKINRLRAKKNSKDPARHAARLEKYQACLRSNQCILDALDIIATQEEAIPSE